MAKGYPITLSVDALMLKAREITGIDIIDSEVIEPLTILHYSLCEESQLHEQGAVAKQEQLLRLLCNRLRMQRDFAAHPEIAAQEIMSPLVVYGMPRSGTTKTQKILAASGDFNWFPFWQTYHPALLSGMRDESPDLRIKEADEYCRWFGAASPDAKLGHAFETFEPEEETPMEGSFVTPSFSGYAEVPSYMTWFGQQGPARYFEFLRDTLKYLQWQGLANASKPWLLKSPMYYGFELELLKAFPNAKLIMLHRSPLQTIPSTCKLTNYFHQPFCEARVDPQATCEGMIFMLNQHLAIRKAHPELKLLDLSFEDITRSSDGAVAKIYAHAGISLSEASSLRMRQWEADHPKHKNGAFIYSLQEYGLNEDAIRRDASDYFELLGTLSEAP